MTENHPLGNAKTRFFAEKDGAEIPKKIVELVENCHKERMSKVESDVAPSARPSRKPSRHLMSPTVMAPVALGQLALSVERELSSPPRAEIGSGDPVLGTVSEVISEKSASTQRAGSLLSGVTRGRDDMVTGMTNRIVAVATNRELSDVARFVASLPPEKLTAVVKASSSWREVVRRMGFRVFEMQLAGSANKPTPLQKLLLVSAALAGSEKDLSATVAQITGQSGGLLSKGSGGLPTVVAPAAHSAPVLQNLLVR